MFRKSAKIALAKIKEEWMAKLHKKEEALALARALKARKKEDHHA